MMRYGNSKGFTLVELLIGMALTTVVMAAALILFKKSVDTSNTLTQRTEMQSELRAAVGEMMRDLNQTGTGIPLGGVPLPSATTGGTNPRIILPINLINNATATYTFSNGQLYKITPGNAIGPNVAGLTDVICVTYQDPNLTWTLYPTTTIALNGSTLTMPAGTTPGLGDAQYGLNVGDTLLLQNTLGAAVGVVTSFNAATRVVTFSADTLNINQTTPTVGNIKAIRGVGASAPSTTVSRLMMVTYFVQIVNGADGPDSRLMRQIGARAPVPIAEHIEDLQLTYDVFDDTTNTLTTALPDAVTGTPPTAKPNQIRKVNVIMVVRSPRRNTSLTYDRLSLTTSVGPRNLSFHDRYN